MDVSFNLCEKCKYSNKEVEIPPFKRKSIPRALLTEDIQSYAINARKNCF